MTNATRNAENGPENRNCQQYNPADGVAEGRSGDRRRQHRGWVKIGCARNDAGRQSSQVREDADRFRRTVYSHLLVFFAESEKRIQNGPRYLKSCESI
jgi:hypothetical protein